MTWLDAGEGRIRFLAMFGLLTNAGFVVGLIFMLLTLFLIPLCR
jgi:tetrahydromethanopterin S-methyltransferase subunit B